MRLVALLPILLVLAGCAAPDTMRQGALSLGLADTALAGGAPRLALQVSQAVLAQHPDNVQALLRQGDSLYALGELPKASASYDRVLKLEPSSAGALLGLGRVTLASDPAAALPRFGQVLALQPHNQAARTDRGIAFDLLGRHTDAQAEYRRAISDGGAEGGTAAKVDLGLSLAMSGDAASAVRILEPIAAAADASARVRQDLAVALVLDGRSDEAERILLTQMSLEQARAALAAYRALGNQKLPPAFIGGTS